MQHPDEGTIHAWLDGALTPDEAAQIEAHVKNCAQCAAAVAEARGFIAASSRILTALDNAPRGVIPATALPKKRFNPMAWRIAASVLVIAGGTLLVVRNQGSRKAAMQEASTMDTARAGAGYIAADSSQAPLSISAAAPAAAPAPSASASRSPATRVTESPRPMAARTEASAAVAGRRDVSGQVANAERRAPAMGKVASPTAGVGDDRDVAAASSAASPAEVSTLAPANKAATGVMDMAAVGQPLKVIATPRRIGARVTVYEIGGDTVTLAESLPIGLSEVVVTGVASTRLQGRAAGAVATPKAAAPKAATPMAAVDSQRPPAPAAPPLAAAPQLQSAIQPDDSTMVRTITWVDPSTGNTLSLSGRMTAARLEQIKLRIEKERAAKKTP